MKNKFLSGMKQKNVCQAHLPCVSVNFFNLKNVSRECFGDEARPSTAVTPKQPRKQGHLAPPLDLSEKLSRVHKKIRT